MDLLKTPLLFAHLIPEKKTMKKRIFNDESLIYARVPLGTQQHVRWHIDDHAQRAMVTLQDPKLNVA